MLQSAIRIEKARTHSADLGTIEQTAKPLIPPLGQHHHVIVGKDQQWRIDHVDRAVVEPRPIKGLVQH